jgi:hypothetical protein
MSLFLMETWIRGCDRARTNGTAEGYSGRGINTDACENFFSRMQHVTKEYFLQKFSKQSVEARKRSKGCGFYYPASNSIYHLGGQDAPLDFNRPEAYRRHELKATGHDSLSFGGAGQQSFRTSIGAKAGFSTST